MCKGQKSPKEQHFFKAVEDTDAEEAETTGGRGNKTFDKEYWKDKEFSNCNKKGHPSISCPEAEKDAANASSSSRSSQAKSVTKLTKGFKKMKKAFTQLQQLQESDSKLFDDDDDEEQNLRFQIADRGFQFTQLNR